MAAPVRIFFLVNQILIDTIPTPFVAGSLIATLNGANVEITRAQSTFLFTSIPWDQVADIDGNVFDGADAVMAYLAGQFAMRRPVGDTFGVAAVAGAALIEGQPVAISRANGTLLPARADTYSLAFVAGLVSATAAGFPGQPERGAFTLNDWTALTGVPSLTPGLPYFLGPTGGLTTVAINDGAVCVARVGIAASTTTMIVDPSECILL